MIKEIYGSFEVKKRFDYFFSFIKVLYLLYTLPFLVFGALYYFITLSNFDESMKINGIGTFGKISIHVLANVVSVIFYFYIFRIFTGDLKLPN